MKTLLWVCIVISAWIALEVRACEVPAVVAIPDGARASAQQLNDVRESIYEYLAAMDDYLVCLEGQIDAAGGRAQVPPDYMTLMINRHNAAVDEMTMVLHHFNAQVQAHSENAQPAGPISSGQSAQAGEISGPEIASGGEATETAGATSDARTETDAD